MYSAYESRKAQFSLNVDHATDLAALTARLVAAISAVNDVETKPPPAIQATGYDGRAITLSISFWYASSMTSDSEALDAVVRTVQGELAKADVSPVPEALSIREVPKSGGRDAENPTTTTAEEDPSSSDGPATT